MLCVKCKKGKTSVEDSRLLVYTDFSNRFVTGTTRRKRQCVSCKHIFRTVEVLEGEHYKKATPIRKKTSIGEKSKRVDHLTDEELEEAIYNGTINFEEDEL
jgi:transcriptional regulator NrdR family protein